MAEQEKKNPFQKLKEGIDDKEEQLAIISNFVRLGVLVWSGFILTLNYITIPGWAQNKIDPTFIASVFTGTLSTYGIATAKKRGDGTFKPEDKPLNKKEVEALLASQSGNYQTIRIETPLRIENAEIIDPPSSKK
jgi:hypothetical protein|tara:strand:- start:54 stop:458 length:405 start_codon:yes stop_codon:yes gene_type:complete